MKKSLLISNVAPEDRGQRSSGRIHRIVKRENILKKYGWEQIVAKISRGRYLPFGILKCIRLIRKYDIDVIHSISEPAHLHLVGYFVSRRSNIPWIAHTQDTILENKPGLSENSFEYKFRKKLEKLVVSEADRVLWDEKGGLIPDDYYEKTYPDKDADKFVRLPPIGFVDETFETISPEPTTKPTILYAGRFYESMEPYDFIDGLAKYVEENGEDSVRFHIYGGWRQEYQRYCKDHGIEEIIKSHDWVSHEELIPKLKGADVLLEIAGTDGGLDNHIGSKMYDYIGARSPILVIGDPSFEAASIVNEYDLGKSIEGDDPRDISEALKQLLSKRYTFNPNQSIYDSFSRENRIRELANVFNSMANRVYKNG